MANIATNAFEDHVYFLWLQYVNLVFLRSVRRLLVTACVVPSSPIFVTLMKEAPGSSETSVSLGISSQRTSVASCSLCCS
jgi:hypothetical protein